MRRTLNADVKMCARLTWGRKHQFWPTTNAS